MLARLNRVLDIVLPAFIYALLAASILFLLTGIIGLVT